MRIYVAYVYTQKSSADLLFVACLPQPERKLDEDIILLVTQSSIQKPVSASSWCSLKICWMNEWIKLLTVLLFLLK